MKDTLRTFFHIALTFSLLYSCVFLVKKITHAINPKTAELASFDIIAEELTKGGRHD